MTSMLAVEDDGPLGDLDGTAEIPGHLRWWEWLLTLAAAVAIAAVILYSAAAAYLHLLLGW